MARSVGSPSSVSTLGELVGQIFIEFIDPAGDRQVTVSLIDLLSVTFVLLEASSFDLTKAK